MTITRLEEVSEFPLCWPQKQPRAAKRVSGREHAWNATMAAGHQKIVDEMRRIGVRSYVVSMSPKHKFGSPDPGVAVWFNAKAKRDGHGHELRVLACDKFEKAEMNLYAIGLSLDRLRALERYGAYTIEQAEEGMRPALPPPPGSETIDWRLVLAVTGMDALPKADLLDIANARYRRAAANAQGDDNELRRLNLAIEAARKDLGT